MGAPGGQAGPPSSHLGLVEGRGLSGPTLPSLHTVSLLGLSGLGGGPWSEAWASLWGVRGVGVEKELFPVLSWSHARTLRVPDGKGSARGLDTTSATSGVMCHAGFSR